MGNTSQNHRTFSLLIGKEVGRILTQLQVIAASMIIALIIIVVAAGWGILSGLGSSVDRSLRTRNQLAILAIVGAIGLIALLAGAVAVEISDRQARKLQDLKKAILKYRFGCLAAGIANFIAGALTVTAIFITRPADGLWLPEVLIVMLNAVGMSLAIPRFKHIRRLHSNMIPPCSSLGRSSKK